MPKPKQPDWFQKMKRILYSSVFIHYPLSLCSQKPEPYVDSMSHCFIIRIILSADVRDEVTGARRAAEPTQWDRPEQPTQLSSLNVTDSLIQGDTLEKASVITCGRGPPMGQKEDNSCTVFPVPLAGGLPLTRSASHASGLHTWARTQRGTAGLQVRDGG